MVRRGLLGCGLACLTSALFFAQALGAERIECYCDFEKGSGHSAFGTRAACSAYMKIDDRAKMASCEIAFGGLGYDPRLLSVLNLDAEEYRALVYRLTQQHLNALREKDIGAISTPEFLIAAIPVYMRAAYLRGQGGLSNEEVAELDREVVGPAKEFAPSVSFVFLDRKGPLDVPWRNDGHFSAERGAVRFTWKGKVIAVVFFDPGASP